MKNRRKFVVLTSVIVIASFLLGTVVTATPMGVPFGEIWEAIFGIQENLDDLQTQIDEIQPTPAGFLVAPAYDSGWIDVTDYWFTLWHGLNTVEVFVYVIRNNSEYGINQFTVNGLFSVEWLSLSENEIEVRVAQITPSPSYDEVRVMIWKISEP